MKKIFLLIFIILTLLTQVLVADKKRNILDQVSENYLKLVPFQLEYLIVQQIANDNSIDEAMGEFYLHNKECFRVNYPGSQILYDSTWLWSIDKLNKQIIVEEFDPRSSLRLIYNVLNGNLSEYKIEKIENGRTGEEKNQFKVYLKSIKSNNFFESMIIWIEKGKNEIKKVEYIDFQDNSITIYFDKYYNHSISNEELFEVKNITSEDFIDLRDQEE